MKFFDSVDLTHLRNELINKELPGHLIQSMIGWNRVPPQNTDTSTNLTWSNENDRNLSINQYKLLPEKERMYYEGLELRKEWRNDFNYYHGVAQGSAISPVLSTFLLIPELLLREKCKSECNYVCR